MNRKSLVIALVVFVLPLLTLVSEALAHAPLGTGDNESLATAALIPDPTKSWAIYAELHEGGEAQYYRFNISEGERIHVMLYKSTSVEDSQFMPGFVLMGPVISNQGDVPSYVEVPSGAKTVVMIGEQPGQATYEPFSPSVFYSLADATLDAPASGTYYIAVYEPFTGGHYGLAVGDRESYSLDEWIFIPLNLISVYQWERQSVFVIFAPLVVTFVVGLGLIVWRERNHITAHTIPEWAGMLAGLLFLGTGLSVLFQMFLGLTQSALAPEVIITLLLALAPILLGIGIIRLALKTKGKVNVRKRIYFAILGIVALFLWAGLLIGPVLAVLASLLPARIKSSSQA